MPSPQIAAYLTARAAWSEADQRTCRQYHPGPAYKCVECDQNSDEEMKAWRLLTEARHLCLPPKARRFGATVEMEDFYIWQPLLAEEMGTDDPEVYLAAWALGARPAGYPAILRGHRFPLAAHLNPGEPPFSW